MTTHHITCDLTKKKAIFILSTTFSKSYLKRLTESELVDLGVKEGLWHRIDKEEVQVTLTKYKCENCEAILVKKGKMYVCLNCDFKYSNLEEMK